MMHQVVPVVSGEYLIVQYSLFSQAYNVHPSVSMLLMKQDELIIYLLFNIFYIYNTLIMGFYID